jgi:hypothetical protein
MRRPRQLACTDHLTESSGFLAVGTPKIMVCSAQINDLEIPQQPEEDACQEIRVWTSVRRRAGSCVEMHGNHTEHLLWSSHEHRPYLSRHWFLDTCWLGLFAPLSEYYTPLTSVTLWRKVAASNPDEVDFFNWPNPSSRTMALVSTQPLTEMSTRNLPGG